MMVNTIEMLMVHRVFRREFHDMAELVDDVEAGDAARATLVGDHITFMLSALHHHHAAEDDHVWPKLGGRVARVDDIQRMRDEHAVIAAAVHRVEALLGPWMESAARVYGASLGAAVAELTERLDEHLDDEERIALPMIEKYLSDEEWKEMIEQAASFVSGRNLKRGIIMGGIVLGAGSDDERRVFLANMPVPQRWMVRLFGPSLAAAYRAQLNGY